MATPILRPIKQDETPRLWMLLDMTFFDITGESHDPGVDPHIDEDFWSTRHDLEALINDVDQEALMSLVITADEGRNAFGQLADVERLVRTFKGQLKDQMRCPE